MNTSLTIQDILETDFIYMDDQSITEDINFVFEMILNNQIIITVPTLTHDNRVLNNSCIIRTLKELCTGKYAVDLTAILEKESHFLVAYDPINKNNINIRDMLGYDFVTKLKNYSEDDLDYLTRKLGSLQQTKLVIQKTDQNDEAVLNTIVRRLA